MSQALDLHRALLRPAVIHILRAAGFQSTRPSVLDTLTDIAERYIMLLASTTARHSCDSHNEPIPTITDARLALTECGVLSPVDGAAEEVWREIMRRPLEEMGKAVSAGGAARVRAEKRKREEEDLRDITEFKRWYDGSQHTEMRRIAGMAPDIMGHGALPAVGVGGGVVQAEDFLTVLKKKHNKAGDDSRWQGTVLGTHGEDKEVHIEGGPVQRIRDWRPRREELSANVQSEDPEEGPAAKAASGSGESGDVIPQKQEGLV